MSFFSCEFSNMGHLALKSLSLKVKKKADQIWSEKIGEQHRRFFSNIVFFPQKMSNLPKSQINNLSAFSECIVQATVSAIFLDKSLICKLDFESQNCTVACTQGISILYIHEVYTYTCICIQCIYMHAVYIYA